MKNKIGFYSARAAELFGTIIYKTPENKEIHVTAIMDEGEDIEHYKWKDKVCLGQVTEYVSKGYAGELSTINSEFQWETRQGERVFPKKLKKSS
jgi:hypothetical protein